MKRRTLLAAPLALAALTQRAHAAEKLGVGFTTGDSVASFAAQDQGYFSKTGLDASLSFIAMNSNVPASLVSDSLQIGSVTPTVFLQAVDNGIDLVAIAGGSSVGPSNKDNYALVVAPGFAYSKPADLVGKRVGVPGFGAIMHVLLIEWLHSHGVDPKGVTYVEATFTSMPDLLKSGALDAVLSIDPFTGRMVGSGIGRFAGSFVDNLPYSIPGLIYIATRAWTDAHPQAAQGARAAIGQGAAYANAHTDEARALITKYPHVPAEVMARMQPPLCTPDLPQNGFSWMIGVMRRQDLLQGKIDEARLILR